MTRIDFLRRCEDGEDAPQLGVLSDRTRGENQSSGLLVAGVRLLRPVRRRGAAETLVERRAEADYHLPMGAPRNSPGVSERHVLGNPLLCSHQGKTRSRAPGHPGTHTHTAVSRQSKGALLCLRRSERVFTCASTPFPCVAS